MFIDVKFNDENYVEGFCTVGGIDGSVKMFVPKDLVTINESGAETLNQSFYKNFFAYKLENDTIVYDQGKFDKHIKDQKEKKANEIKEQIRELYQQREFYEFKKWSTSNIDRSISELETQLKTDIVL